MANIVISRIQHRRGRRENLPQPLLPAEVALTSDTSQAWIGQDPTLAVPNINVYADKLEATAQIIVDNNIVETRFDENMTVTVFNTLVAELGVAVGVTLVAADILWDDTYRGTIETVSVVTPGTGYTTGDIVTAISATGSAFTGTVTAAAGAITGVTITNGGINYRSANTTFTIATGTGGALSVAVTDIYGSTVHIAANPVVDSGNTIANIDTTIDALSTTITDRLMGDAPPNNAAFGGTFSGNSLPADNHIEAANVVALINRVNSTTPGQVTGLTFTNLNIEITGGSSSATTVLDGTGTPQPIGFNTIPIYEIDVNAIFDIAHQGMIWHKDSGVAVTFTCDNVSSISQGSSWAVHNDDAENLTIAEGTGVTINFLTAGSAPSAGDVTVEQGGIVTVYKYTDTEYWIWGDKELLVQAAATVITVADTADTTTFPVLVGNATGDEIPLTDGGLTYNAGTAALTTTTFIGTFEGSNANGPTILDEAAAANNATVAPDKTDTDSGMGSAGADAPTIVAGAVEAVRYTEATGIIQANQADVGLTADVGSAQGNGVILSTYNVYSTVGTIGDAATLPATFIVGTLIHIKNDGGLRMDVFPASGDDAGAGTDTAFAVQAGDFAVFIATVADTTWTKLMSGTA